MVAASKGYHFLLIGKKVETQWPLVLQRALSPLGELRVVSEEQAMQTVDRKRYDVLIIDAGAIRNAVLLVSRLRSLQPDARIVVATATPTWRRAREILQAGAADYIRKSFDERKLRARIQAVLEAPPPSWSNKAQET